MFRIMRSYQGKTDEIDAVDSAEDAEFLKREYQTAFGPSCSVWIQKPKPRHKHRLGFANQLRRWLKAPPIA